MTEAVIYTRVSSREQEQEGFSLDAQAKLLRQYAAQNGIRIVEAFEDIETAKVSGRKHFSSDGRAIQARPCLPSAPG